MSVWLTGGSRSEVQFMVDERQQSIGCGIEFRHFSNVSRVPCVCVWPLVPLVRIRII